MSDASIETFEEARKRLPTNCNIPIDSVLIKKESTICNKLPDYMTDIANTKSKDVITEEEDQIIESAIKKEPDDLQQEIRTETKKKRKLNLDEYRMRIKSANNSRCSSPLPVEVTIETESVTVTTSPIVHNATITPEVIETQDIKPDISILSQMVMEKNNNKKPTTMIVSIKDTVKEEPNDEIEIEEGELLADSECEVTPIKCEEGTVNNPISLESPVKPDIFSVSNKPTNAVKPVQRVKPTTTSSQKINLPNSKTPEKPGNNSLSSSSSSGCSSLCSPPSGGRRKNKRSRHWSSSSHSRSRSRSRSPNYSSNRSRRRKRSSRDHYHNDSKRGRSRSTRRKYSRFVIYIINIFSSKKCKMLC